MLHQRFYGKCILSGEHSVLRGFPALVYPVFHHHLDMTYKENQEAFKIIKEGPFAKELDFCLSPLFDKAFASLGKSRKDLKGSLTLKSCIPVGAGLGASAVLSVAIACLMKEKGWLENVVSFAKELESLFHGVSSGMDVCAVFKQKSFLYQDGQVKKNFL